MAHRAGDASQLNLISIPLVALPIASPAIWEDAVDCGVIAILVAVKFIRSNGEATSKRYTSGAWTVGALNTFEAASRQRTVATKTAIAILICL